MDSKGIAYKRNQDGDSDSPIKKMKMGSAESRTSDTACNQHMHLITDDSNPSQVLCDRIDGNGSGRREKRLAMNRTSARLRRQRTKVLIKALQGEVNELSKSNASLQLENETIGARIINAERELYESKVKIATLMNRNQSRTDFELNPTTNLNPNRKLSVDSLLASSATNPNYSVNRYFHDHQHSNTKNSTAFLLDEILKSVNPYNPSVDLSTSQTRPRDSLMAMSHNKILANRIAYHSASMMNRPGNDIEPTATYGSILRSESEMKLLEEAQRRSVINDLLAKRIQENTANIFKHMGW